MNITLANIRKNPKATLKNSPSFSEREFLLLNILDLKGILFFFGNSSIFYDTYLNHMFSWNKIDEIGVYFRSVKHPICLIIRYIRLKTEMNFLGIRISFLFLFIQ